MTKRRKFLKDAALVTGGSLLPFNLSFNKTNVNYKEAPFKNLDTLCVNDWWNRPSNPIVNLKVDRKEIIAFGIYTLSNNILKISAQTFPLYPNESRTLRLEIKRNAKWQEIAQKNINEIGWSTVFRIKNWNGEINQEYRLVHENKAMFYGLIRKNPVDKKIIKLAAFSCNSNKDRGGRDNYIKNVNHHDPDLLFFGGDQSYDHKEHTAAWIKFGLQFRELFRTRPCITIPDDHDIGQGNLWGENGKKADPLAKEGKGNDGGYFYHPEYVKMVERCQTSHLPDPYDPTPVEQGIGVYYTSLNYGEIDFAIIEDRKFKSGPKGKIPQQGPRPDHIIDPDYNPDDIDLDGLTLLGNRQLNFLSHWSKKSKKNNIKAVLSATSFCGAAHLHGNKQNRLHADLDSNGWPQSGRKKALKVIKKANAVHIGGDQHLASIVHHGIDDFEDGPYQFIVPALVNNYYSRWWWPKNEKPGKKSNKKLPWTGRYLDGFNNKITMHAYANPDSFSNGSGYGIILFDKEKNSVKFECWPRFTDVTKKGAKQFKGWPFIVNLKED
ncbi:MAG: hypothetical protein CMC79_01435 [Flavobacteriaceae bacterium]|nr:hypothetical protein [Flavobacteriaceae bacterium]|tara:strand:- start:4494 stop:6143 length:1650 start_codon:yes stop_codon:yes gene_type:complete